MARRIQSSLPLTEADIDRAFEHVVGLGARTADKAIVTAMGSTRIALAEYLWDHWMGEPTDISIAQVRDAIDWVLAIKRDQIGLSDGSAFTAQLVVYRDYLTSNGRWALNWQNIANPALGVSATDLRWKHQCSAIAYAERVSGITPVRGRGFVGDIAEKEAK